MKIKLTAFILLTAIIIGTAVPVFAADKKPIYLGYADTDWMAEEILKKIPQIKVLNRFFAMFSCRFLGCIPLQYSTFPLRRQDRGAKNVRNCWFYDCARD